MNETSTYGYQEDPPGGQASGSPTPALPLQPGQYKFSSEELAVLGECNRESFFKRSLPTGTLLGLGTYYALQKGHLKPNPRFGVFPKITLAVLMGYIIGKVSYQEACAEKLMALPGSYIGQLLRERKEGKIRGSATQKNAPTMFGARPGDIYSDAGPGNSLDLDTDRPLFNEDSYRPDSNAYQPKPHEEETPRKTMSSYDELRKRNRGENADAKQDPYRYDQVPPITRRPTPPPPHPPSPATNKYGDVMD